MPFERKRSTLILTTADQKNLESLSTSRSESHGRVQRASMLLAYVEGQSICSIAKSVGVSRPTVERCVDKALAGGIKMALSDLPRKGRPCAITSDDRMWVANLACKKPKEGSRVC